MKKMGGKRAGPFERGWNSFWRFWQDEVGIESHKDIEFFTNWVKECLEEPHTAQLYGPTEFKCPYCKIDTLSLRDNWFPCPGAPWRRNPRYVKEVSDDYWTQRFAREDREFRNKQKQERVNNILFKQGY